MEGRPPVWNVAANILNKLSRTADKGWSPRSGLSEMLTNPHRKKTAMLRTFTTAPYVEIRKHECLTVQCYRPANIKSVHYSYNQSCLPTNAHELYIRSKHCYMIRRQGSILRESHISRSRSTNNIKIHKIYSLTQLSIKQLLLKNISYQYLTATCFGSFLRSHLQVELYFKKVLYAIDNVLLSTRSRITLSKIL